MHVEDHSIERWISNTYSNEKKSAILRTRKYVRERNNFPIQRKVKFGNPEITRTLCLVVLDICPDRRGKYFNDVGIATI